MTGSQEAALPGVADLQNQVFLAYKRMPYEVIQPIMTLLGWLLWVVMLSCMAWLLVSAARFWLGYRSGDLIDGDATHGVLVSLLGALMASTASGIALALLPS